MPMQVHKKETTKVDGMKKMSYEPMLENSNIMGFISALFALLVLQISCILCKRCSSSTVANLSINRIQRSSIQQLIIRPVIYLFSLS
jgi:predicted metal-binding protein